MRVSFFLLAIIMILNVSCSTTETRNPASVKEEKESAHERFQGVFDKQY
jgi:hypothetical protein